MSENWMDVARETMTEDEIHGLLVGVEKEVHADREAALERAHDNIAGHFKNVVLLAWNEDGDLAVVGDRLDRAAELLQKARRYDAALDPLRAHLRTSS